MLDSTVLLLASVLLGVLVDGVAVSNAVTGAQIVSTILSLELSLFVALAMGLMLAQRRVLSAVTEDSFVDRCWICQEHPRLALHFSISSPTGLVVRVDELTVRILLRSPSALGDHSNRRVDGSEGQA